MAGEIKKRVFTEGVETTVPTDVTLGQLYTNASSGNVSVASGKTLWHPFLTVSVGDTYTVDSGGRLVSEGALTVDGTLVVNGTCRVL